jgi:hypothetical protein
MVVRHHALYQLERESLRKGVELEIQWLLSISEETEILENGKRVLRCWPEGGGRAVWKFDNRCGDSRRGIGCGCDQSLVLLDNFVDDKHDELPQCRGRRRRHDCNTRLV